MTSTSRPDAQQARISASSLAELGECLRRHEQEHQALVEHSADVIARYDRQLRCVYINNAVEPTTGKRAEFFLGKRPSEMGAPDKFAQFWEQQISRVIELGEEWSVEGEWPDRGGEICRIYQARLVPETGPDGSVETVMLISRDVTAMREAERAARRSEQYYHAMIADSADMIAVLGPNGCLLFGSPSVERLLGYTQSELSGKSALDLVHPDDHLEVARVLMESLLTPGKVHTVEARLRTADGVWLNFEIRGKSVHLEGGKPRIVLNARDVTARRQLEEQLRESHRMDSIGRLAGGIAHDYNNLLATILANCELLLGEAPSDPDLREGLEDILRAGRRAAGLTHQLLAFGRRQVLRPTLLDLGSLLQDMEPLIRERLGAGISLQMPAAAGQSIDADESQIRQVLLSLAENARDAMPHGGRFSIETGMTDLTSDDCRLRPGMKPGPHVVITVSDTGKGMSPTTASHIFEPFFTTKGPGRTTDLGLATVHGIIVQSGGGIEVESMLGQGTRFRMLLPRAQGHALLLPAEPAREAAGVGTKTILLVEDDPAVRHVTTRLLKRLGYKVLVASEPGEAMAIAREHSGQIALVVSDVSLPGMEGPALVRRLREIRPGIRVLLVSGYVGTTAIPAETLDGDTAFLKKPFSIAELGQMIQQQLAGAAPTNAQVRHPPMGPINGAERPHRWAPPIRVARRNWLPDLALPLGNEAA